MLVVDAGALYQVVTRGPASASITARLLAEEAAAPHILDVEVLGVIRRWFLAGELDGTAASLAVENLRNWNGQRFGHQLLLRRAWELRANVRGWDAMYVALAELLGATLLTTDARLARAPGLECPVEVITRE